MSPTLLSIVLMLFMLSAYIADFIGLHAVFGGFLLGTVMPRGALADNLRKLLEPFTVVLLLPMFFTYSGLNTQLSMVNNVELLLMASVILLASIAKFGACWAAARLIGQDNSTALGIGALDERARIDGTHHHHHRPAGRRHRAGNCFPFWC